MQGTGYYDIEDVTNKWLFMAVTYNGKKKKVRLKNFFDSSNTIATKFKEVDESNFTRNASGKLLIGNGRGWGINDFYYRGLMDEVRVYTRALSEDEIDTIYNIEDTEPPVPGGMQNNDLKWNFAKDDHSEPSELKYLVVKHTDDRITTPETALRNGTILMDWTYTNTHTVSGSGFFVTVLVKDKAGNISSYGVISK